MPFVAAGCARRRVGWPSAHGHHLPTKMSEELRERLPTHPYLVAASRAAVSARQPLSKITSLPVVM